MMRVDDGHAALGDYARDLLDDELGKPRKF